MSTDRFDAMAGEWDAIPSVVQSAKLAAEFVAAQIEKLPQKPASALEVRYSPSGSDRCLVSFFSFLFFFLLS
jgi:hypothetical protein